MVATSKPAQDGPYVGLGYYTEADAQVFFGREAERKIIIANLRASRLTLLYAGSGVGKSSLIRAGVASRLRELAERSRNELGSPRYVAVVFNSWRDDPLDDLIGEIESAIRPYAMPAASLALPRTGLADAIQTATAAVDATLLIVLDQFEEYFLYHSRELRSGRLAEHLAGCIRRSDLRANFLIAVRDDAYAGLGDLFKGSIENVYGNYLHLDYLDRAAAREAIARPIEYFNATHPGLDPIAVEPELVEAVLDQVRAGEVLLEQSGHGTVAGHNGHNGRREEIETPYLQLVMTTLWAQERAAGSHVLRLATLRDLGGAQEIVRSHLDVAMAGLSPAERETAVDVFHHLVTPSGTKIVHTVPDLVAYSGRPREQVEALIEKLSSGQQRILRPVPPAPGEEDKPRVEIFHDVLAPAILAWRTQQTALRLEHEKQAAEDRARRERRRARISIALAAGMLAALVLALIAVVVADVQRNRAHRAQTTAESRQLAAQAINDFQAALGRGLLLGIEAYRLAPTAEARGTLVGGLVRTEGMVGYLKNHVGVVHKVAFSPQGDLVASASADQTVGLWNLRTGVVRTLRGHSRAVRSVAFSTDGRLLASAGEDGKVIVWDAVASRAVATLFARRGPVNDIAFAPSGTLIAAGNDDGTVILWDASTGRRLRTLAGHAGPVTSVAFDHAGGAVAAGTSGGSVIIWDAARGGRLHTMHGAGGGVNAVAFSPVAPTLAVAQGAGYATLWDATTGRRLHNIRRVNTTPLEAVNFSPDGRTLAAGGDDTDVRTWDVGTGHLLRTFQGHTETVESVAFSPDGRTIVSGGDDEAVIVWDASLGQGTRTLVSAHGAAIGIAFSPDGRTLASANNDGTVGVWDLATGAERTYRGHTNVVESVAYSLDGRMLASGSDDGSVVVWDARSGARRARLSAGSGNGVYGVAISPDGGSVAGAALYGGVFVWNASTGQLVRQLAGHAGAVYTVAFSRDGRELATGGADGSVIVYDPSGRRVQTLAGHTGGVEGVAFSPDGKVLASASDDRSITLWDVRTGRQLGDPLRGHQDIVYSVAFSPDGRTLASGSADHTVIVWNLATRLGQPLDGHANSVNGLAFSAHGTLAAADQDGRIVLYSSLPAVKSPAAIYQRLCSVVRRNLTAAEWRAFVPGPRYRETCPGFR